MTFLETRSLLLCALRRDFWDHFIFTRGLNEARQHTRRLIRTDETVFITVKCLDGLSDSSSCPCPSPFLNTTDTNFWKSNVPFPSGELADDTAMTVKFLNCSALSGASPTQFVAIRRKPKLGTHLSHDLQLVVNNLHSILQPPSRA